MGVLFKEKFRMPFKIRYGILGVLAVLMMLLVAPTHPANAIQGIGADLFYLAPDAATITQVWKIDSANSVIQLTNETANVNAYDVAYNNTVAFVTDRSLSVNQIPVTAGGPLDSPALRLVDVSFAPTATWVAVVAVAPDAAAVDPSEGVWLYRVQDQSWRLAINSTKSDPNNAQVFTSVEWAETGDRLILDARFSAQTGGVTVYSLSTGHNVAYNQGGTDGIIDPNGYGRGSISLDGTSVILSDVPGAPVGNGFVVDINNYTRIVSLGDGSLASRYLSHATPIRGGTAFFIRDFGNNITSSEVWHLSFTGARVALGSIPNADLGRDADWTPDGIGLVYLNQMDDATGLGTPHVYQRVGELMQEVPLPPEASRARAVQWGPNLNETGLTSVVDIKVAEPLIAFQDEGGNRFYSVRLQWNSVAGGNGTYRLTINPGFDGQTTFDVQGVAAKFNKMQCENTYTITIAAYDAAGTAGTDSQAVTASIPPCGAAMFPVLVDIYAELGAASSAGTTSQQPAPTQAPPAAQPTVEQPLATEEAAPAQSPATQPTPEVIPPGTEQGGAATVADLVAGQAIQEGTFTTGAIAYAVDLTWSPPSQTVPFYLVAVSPPFGDNQRPRFPVQYGGTPPVVAHIPGLACGLTYTFVVQSIAGDGITVLSNSAPATVTTPACQ
jgi:hypothetical protein